MKEKNVVVKIYWQDIYKANDCSKENLLKTLNDGDCIYYSVGEIVYNDKKRIVILQNSCDDRSDFIVIPKSVIVKIVKYAP